NLLARHLAAHRTRVMQESRATPLPIAQEKGPPKVNKTRKNRQRFGSFTNFVAEVISHGRVENWAGMAQNPGIFMLSAVKSGFSIRFRDATGAGDPQTEQIKIGSSIHTAFDQFEAIGMAFEQTVAVG